MNNIPGIEHKVNKNENINSDFRIIMIQAFSHMYKMLGEQNFRRWINGKNFSEKVKNIIVKEFDEDIDFAKRKSIMGYYTWSTNTIRTREKYKENMSEEELDRYRTITIHETFHYFSDNGNNFEIFLNEGMTQYLAEWANGKEQPNCGYRQNVQMVKLLHGIIGDSFIKAYLLGDKEQFEDRFLKYAMCTKSELNEFYDCLTKEHSISLYPKEYIAKNGKDKTYADYKNIVKVARMMTEKVLCGKVAEMSKEMIFYKNGEFDYDSMTKKISEIVNLGIPCLKSHCCGAMKAYEIKELTSKLIDVCIENGHFLVGIDEKERANKKNEILKCFNINLERDENGKVSLINIDYDKENESLKENKNEVVSKVIQKEFSNKTTNLDQFIRSIVKIYNISNFNDEDIHRVISEMSEKYWGKSEVAETITSLVKENIPRYVQIFNMEKEKNENTVISQYRKIGNDSYIEQRDNEFFYIKFDSKGVMHEVKLGDNSYYKDNNNIKIEALRENQVIPPKDRTEETVKPIIYKINDNGRKYTMSIGEDLKSFSLYNSPDKYKDFGIMSMDRFMKYEISAPFINEIRKNISNRKYMQILNDAKNPYENEENFYLADIDERSRNLKIKDFTTDLSLIDKFNMDRTLQHLIKSTLTHELLYKTFSTELEPYIDVNVEHFKERREKGAYLNLHSMISNGDENTQRIETTVRILNQYRKQRVEKNPKEPITFNSQKKENKNEYLSSGYKMVGVADSDLDEALNLVKVSKTLSHKKEEKKENNEQSL